MNKPWRYQSTRDQLRIFVSSRIEECRREREVIRDAIRELRHQPILFEAIGSRPYPPRDLYLSRLSDSDVMVAIYRSGYGYIDLANDMKISGLEDEYRYALEEGIDTVYYVWRNREGREPRLAELIDEIGNGRTLVFYDEPEQLGEFVKRDLTAVITSRFLAATSQRGVLEEGARQILARAATHSATMAPRNEIKKRVLDALNDSYVVCLNGPRGAGKTTLAAQISEDLDGILLRATGLAPKEIFALCTVLVSGGDRDHVPSYSSLEGARLALASAWAEASSAKLVVDECDFVAELRAALVDGGGFARDKTLLFTSVGTSGDSPNIEIPALTAEEVELIVGNQFAETHVRTSEQFAGTPLDVQNALAFAARKPGALLPADVRGSAGEVLRYLALARTYVTADEILRLRADVEYSIDALTDDIQQFGPLVEDTARGYRLIDDSTIEAVMAELIARPQRHRFFATRLIQLAEDKGAIRLAYAIACKLNDESERKYVGGAIRESVRLGDMQNAIALVEQSLSWAIDEGSKSEVLHHMLSLVYPLEVVGNTVRAAAMLDQACEFARTLGEESLLLCEEVRVSANARRALSAADVEKLKQIRTRYAEKGNRFDEARVGLELSALYVSSKNYDDAVQILRPTLETFISLGDDYGADLAERNLASALSETDDAEEEAERLIQRIAARTKADPEARRQRAWLCNVLTRRMHSAKRFDEAEKLAREAISLAEELGDESLRAINLVNLGNIFRSKAAPEDAIEAYEAAALAASRCDRRDIQGDASRLVAQIYNDFDVVEGVSDRRHRAELYALSAVAMLRDSVYHDALARAYWELAEALEALGKMEDAVAAVFSSAHSFWQDRDFDNFGRGLLYATRIALPNHRAAYVRGLAFALDLDPKKLTESLLEDFLLLVPRILSVAPKAALIGMLGMHLEYAYSRLSLTLQRGFAQESVERLRQFSGTTEAGKERWRVLYAGIAVASVMKQSKQPYLHHRLAESVVNNVPDISFREEGDGSRGWTVVANMGRRITLSVSPLDVTPATSLACFVLAVFLKAFENELYSELIGSGTDVNELLIQVASIDAMPTDIRKVADDAVSLEEILSRQVCVASRRLGFEKNVPTYVFLASDFLEQVSVFGEGGHALELLLGLTLTEVVFQMLRGQVEMEAISPKIVSLLRKARP
ncbi:DUF4062 domain-containing protein [Trinickia violacea]|uniref:DUF4062 domain-containing protein n=1 Tax=Trinickia violacea TaxID=2571746 RepID=A0A4P8IT84_9BURK|nr:DUF4062 domain-containing protein [Trinickia violacea]QCP49039.1 DUF4062 domain-containing protein [Trinickia violacea]